MVNVDQYLVGGCNPSDNLKVTWDDYSQYMEKHGKTKDVPNDQSAMVGHTLPHDVMAS